MSSPLIFSLLAQKYGVQTRKEFAPWRDHSSHRTLKHAREVAAALKRKTPALQTRVINRLTHHVLEAHK